MALNDRKMTEKVKDASIYFSDLRNEAERSPKQEAELKKREMLEAAAWASCFLATPFQTKIVCEKIRKHGYIPSMAVEWMNAQRYVNTTVASYGTGNRKFGKYTFQQIGRVCDTLANYINLVKKERAAKLYYSKIFSEGTIKKSFFEREKSLFKEISKELDLSVKEVKHMIRTSIFNEQTVSEGCDEEGIRVCV